MRGDEVYKKVGRRYVKLGTQFTGFPMDGVWLVEDGRNSCIMKVGELLDPQPLAQMQRGHTRACAELRALLDDPKCRASISDMVDTVLKAVAKEQEDENVGRTW